MTRPADDSWSDFVAGRAAPRRVEPGPAGTGPGPARRALTGRFAVALAGLLAAGTLLLGVALAIGMVVVPSTGGTGLTESTGPGWWRAGWQLGVGAASEVAVLAARRMSWPGRVAVSCAVIAGTLAVLALGWWV